MEMIRTVKYKVNTKRNPFRNGVGTVLRHTLTSFIGGKCYG